MKSSTEEWKVISIGKMKLRWIENPLTQKRLIQHQDVVDNAWAKACDQSKIKLFNGPLLNWVGLKQENDGAEITGHFVDYKYFFVSKERPDLDLNIFSVAVSGISLFREHGVTYTVFARRSENVSSYAGRLELVPSGSIDRKFADKAGMIDYQSQLRSEFCEETGLPDDCINDVVAFAFILDVCDRVYDICCRIIVDVPKDVLIDQLSRSKEYQHPVIVAEDELDKFVGSHRDSMIPSSVALLEAYKQAKKREGIF